MKLAFVCAPYRADTHNEVWQNIQRAREMATRLWAKGYAVLCPQLNTAFFSGVIDERLFLDGIVLMLSKCDLLVHPDDGKITSGMSNEIEFATNHGIAVLAESEA